MVIHMVTLFMTMCPCVMGFIRMTGDGASPETPCCLQLCFNWLQLPNVNASNPPKRYGRKM